jgi:alpha-methylacyl-CoA racemase
MTERRNYMLQGIKVIDFTQYIPGPFATLRLAELGAEVVKIEAPEGELARNTDTQQGREGLVFLAHNRQKKSVVLDLKKQEDVERAKQIINEADVLIESFRPGVMNRLGLGYEQVKKLNPKLVYCSITGYGNNGPLSHMGSHDLNYLSLSGVLSQWKSENGKPVHPTHTIADYIGGLTASERILAALIYRTNSAEGSYHCISITDAMTSLMGTHLLYEQMTGQRNGIPVLDGSTVSYSLYETKDHRYISLGCIEEKFWKNFCFAVEREDWLEGHYSKKVEQNPIYQEMKALFKSKTLKEWSDFGQQVDCCLAPVLEVNEIIHHPYFKHNRQIFDAEWGDIQVRMHGDIHGPTDTPPPKKGEHTEMELKSLGMVDKLDG